MGKYLLDNGISVSGYYSPSESSSQAAAEFTATRHYSQPAQLVQDSSLIFFTVPDNAIQQAYHSLQPLSLQGKCLVHCSGSLSSRIFEGAGERGARTCSLHPICAVSHKFTGHHALAKAFFTIEGAQVDDIAQMIRSCGNTVAFIPPDKKPLYHGAAVVASNLVVGLFHQATAMLEDCGLDEEFARHALLPLFIGNAQNILRQGAVAALTGPVERGDSHTVIGHLEALRGRQREIYRLLSLQLLELARQKNPRRDYQPLADALEDGETRLPAQGTTAGTKVSLEL